MNKLLDAMKVNGSHSYTENGGKAYSTTMNGLLDLFAFGGAYRSRSEEDCILLFMKAFKENEPYAMKCLFYLRDVRGGQGERRFFRTVMNYLAIHETEVARRNLQYVAEYGRWDDLYTFVGTPLESEAFDIMYHQLALDVSCKTPSLLAKWLKSENTSSAESRALAAKTRKAFNMTAKQYRKTLSTLREKIRIVERLMSENRWDEIEFDKIPSKAGLIYRNAFARRDIIKAKYEQFAKDDTKSVNAGTLNPCDIAHRAFEMNTSMFYGGVKYKYDINSPERIMLQKYWDELPNYYGENKENGIAVIDVSGSMYGQPIEAAVSMGAYIAEKAHGPFAGHFITFSARPELVPFEGVDIVDKFNRCIKADWGMNTNIEAVFDTILHTAISKHIRQEDMPTRIYIFSDMQWDAATRYHLGSNAIDTLMESVKKEWEIAGYKMPSLIFWNLNARRNTIPAIGEGFSYISGFSPIMIEQILSGKDGIDLMLAKLNSDRYKVIS